MAQIPGMTQSVIEEDFLLPEINEEQLKIKETQVRGMIEQAIGDACAYEFLPIRHSPRVLAYRNKMEFSFGDEYKDGPLALGMHKRGSFYDIVTVEDW